MAYENFLTDYTEVDPTGDITRTSTKTSWLDIPHTATTAKVYCIKGTNYFSGAYKHQFEIQYTSTTPNVVTLFWAIFVGETYGEALYTNLSRDLILERENGGTQTDTWYDFQRDTTYYITITRTAGGTLTAEIRTGSHTGNLEATLQVTGATGNCDRIFSYYNLGDSSESYATGFTQNLNLEAGVVNLAGTVAISSTAVGEFVIVSVEELAGVVAIESTVIGELVSPVKELAGVVAIESTVEGELVSPSRELAGIVTISSVVTGELVRIGIQELAGVVAIESVVTGQISLDRRLAGVVAISTTATGEFVIISVVGLAGVVAIESTVVGELVSPIRSLAGVIAISTTVIGEIKPDRGLAGVVAIESTVIGELLRTGIQELAGVVTISSTVIGSLSLPEDKMLSGVVAIHATVTGELIVRYIEIPPFMHKDLIDFYSGGAWLWLVQIAVPTQSTVRIARNTEDVKYGGDNYDKFNLQIGNQIFSGDGSIPRVTLRVFQDYNRIIEDIINDTEGALGAEVKLIRVNEKFLNTPVAALEQNYKGLATESDTEWVTFTLGIPNPLTQRFPLREFDSSICPWSNPESFKGVRCQYAGGDSTCTGTYEDCFTKGNAIHWGAELGLDPNVVRV